VEEIIDDGVDEVEEAVVDEDGAVWFGDVDR